MHDAPEPPMSDVGSAASRGFAQISEMEIWRGRVVRLVRTEWSAPDGTTMERDVVRHPGAVAVVAITGGAAPCVLLVRQFRAPLGREVLEVPAGTLDVAGEPPAEAARRELMEEVGMLAGRIEALGTMLNSPGFTDQRTHLFLASDLTECEMRPEGVEERHMSVVEMPVSGIDAAIASGEIADAQSLLGLLMARRVLGI